MMRDRPTGAELGALAEEFSARGTEGLGREEGALARTMLRRCREIAAREGRLSDAGWPAIGEMLVALYGPGDAPAHYARFARDIRAGAFDEGGPRRDQAVALLWAVTIEKLRASNPRFLAAHGLD